MTEYIIIPRGDGVVTHTKVDSDMMNLSDDAEIYEDRDEFKERLSEFDQS